MLQSLHASVSRRVRVVMNWKIFLQPVDARQVPDYHQYVRPENAMCISVIDTNVQRCRYRSAAAYLADWRQVRGLCD